MENNNNKVEQAQQNVAANFSPVKMREHKATADLSETERKRRSKHRLSNRRSTGFLYPEDLEEIANFDLQNHQGAATNSQCLQNSG